MDKRREKKSKLSTFVEKLEREDDCLSSKKLFEIEEKPLTMFEQEKLEEETLIRQFANLGDSLRKNDKEEFLKHFWDLNKNSLKYFKMNKLRRTSSSDTSDQFSIDSVKNNMSSILENCSTKDASNSIEFLLSQNVEVAEDKIKVMVLGEKHVGKTNLISVITNNKVNQSYVPSEKYI